MQKEQKEIKHADLYPLSQIDISRVFPINSSINGLQHIDSNINNINAISVTNNNSTDSLSNGHINSNKQSHATGPGLNRLQIEPAVTDQVKMVHGSSTVHNVGTRKRANRIAATSKQTPIVSTVNYINDSAAAEVNDTDMMEIEQEHEQGQDSDLDSLRPSKKRQVEIGGTSVPGDSALSSPIDACKSTDAHIQNFSLKGDTVNYNTSSITSAGSGLLPNDEFLLPLPSPSASPVQSDNNDNESVIDGDKRDRDMSLVINHIRKSDQVLKIPNEENELASLLANLIDLLPDGSNSSNMILWKLLQKTDRKNLSVISNVVKNSLRKDIISLLPSEVTMKIFSYLDFSSLKRTSEICKSWLQLSSETYEFWKKLVFEDGLMAETEDYDKEFYWISNQKKQLNQAQVAKLLYKRRYIISRRWRNTNFRPRRITLGNVNEFIQLGVVTCLQFDDDKIVAGSDNYHIIVYDTCTGKVRNCLSGHKGGVWAMKYSGNTLASGSTDHTVRIWNIKQGKCTHIFKGHVSTVRCLDIIEPAQIGVDDEGKPTYYPPTPLLVTGSRDSTLYIWELPVSGEDDEVPDEPIELYEHDNKYLLKILRGHSGSIRAVAGYANTLVSISYDSIGRVWDLRTGECKSLLLGHTDRIYTTALDIKRNRCISGSSDSSVRIWDLSTGENISVLEGHSLLVGLITLSNNALVSAAADSTVRIWDPETGKPRHILRGHTGAITCVQHDDNVVLSGSNGMLKLWDTKTGDFIRDLVDDVDGGVWQVKFDYRRCIAAVQKNGQTCIEIIDFGIDVCDGLPDFPHLSNVSNKITDFEMINNKSESSSTTPSNNPDSAMYFDDDMN